MWVLGTPAPPGGNISVRSERYPHIPRGKTHHNPQLCWGALVPACRIYPPHHHLLKSFPLYKEKTDHTLFTHLRLLLVLFHNRSETLHLYPKLQYYKYYRTSKNSIVIWSLYQFSGAGRSTPSCTQTGCQAQGISSRYPGEHQNQPCGEEYLRGQSFASEKEYRGM